MKHLIWTTALLILNLTSFAQCTQGDCKNGHGLLVFETGNKYKGEFKDGKRHGEGTFIWKSGAKYKGDWRDDQMSGTGTYIYPDRRHYKGEFSNNKIHGTGTLFDAEGSILKEGEWEMGEFVEQEVVEQKKKKEEKPEPKRQRNIEPEEEEVDFAQDEDEDDDEDEDEKVTHTYVCLGASVWKYIDPSYQSIHPWHNITGYAKAVEPIFLSYEFGVAPFLSIGPLVGVSQIEIYGTGEYEGLAAKYQYAFGGGRLVLMPFALADGKVKPYIGGMAGYMIVNPSDFQLNSVARTHLNVAQGGVIYDAFLGIRLFPTENLGIFAEAGYNFSKFTTGISIRF